MGDSGLEILHGGVCGDVELGARTSKHIFVFAFDPLSLNSLSFICAKHHSVSPKAYHPSFDDDQLMKLCLLMILCLISDRFIIKILVGA